MRAKIAKAVRELFSRKLQQEMGYFEPLRTSKIRKGDLLFCWSVNSAVNAYIYLFISPKYDQDRFTVELACSQGDFPLQMARQPSHEVNGKIRFRLPQLFKSQWPKRGWEPMWEVGPHDSPREAIDRAHAQIKAGEIPGVKDNLIPIDQALKLVEPQVQDAIDKIRKFGIPFFQKIGGHNSEKT